MTDVAVKNSPATELDNAATETADESVSGTQLNLTTDDLAQLLDIKEAQRDRAHALLEQAQQQLSAAQHEVDQAEEGVAVVEQLNRRGVSVLATLA
jgi:hypothetical protein